MSIPIACREASWGRKMGEGAELGGPEGELGSGGEWGWQQVLLPNPTALLTFGDSHGSPQFCTS